MRMQPMLPALVGIRTVRPLPSHPLYLCPNLAQVTSGKCHRGMQGPLISVPAGRAEIRRCWAPRSLAWHPSPALQPPCETWGGG